LSERLNKDFSLFEFGSGNSTLWYAARVKQVVAVEHNQQWYNQVEASMPTNAQLLFKDQNQGQDYEKAILETNTKYDIVIIDGVKRIECGVHAVQALTDNGVVILDNSDRSIYQPIKDQLKELGYKSIDFWGAIPIVANISCTTVFYKPNNCLNI
jgi:predicted O-methyltransferase YrrM